MFENEKNREMNTQIRLRTRKDHYTQFFLTLDSSDIPVLLFWKAFR